MNAEEFIREWNDGSERLLVHTSGSTGAPKPMWVEKSRMKASALTTCRFLGLNAGDTALLCMPLDYIAGKMMVVRAIVCGLRLIEVPPSGHPLAGLKSAPTFAAMVPMQVYNSLRVAEERRLLGSISHLIIGGGAIDNDMAAELACFGNAVWSTYGMTETLSHIALRRLSGPEASEWYTPFDGVSVSLTPDGCLAIDAPDVCATTITTNDIARLAPDGRRAKLTTLTLRLPPEEVERMLAPHIGSPFIVTKRKDPKYGEAVVLLVQSADTAGAEAACRSALPKYWQPHHIISVCRIPTTATGKPARKEAERLADESR